MASSPAGGGGFQRGHGGPFSRVLAFADRFCAGEDLPAACEIGEIVVSGR
ncbi:MAG TPA: hypothetical protein VMS73_00210 [Anaerolineaceae bacterium]|nr:hypothetical protein [Anaerolineaceae bacterium]